MMDTEHLADLLYNHLNKKKKKPKDKTNINIYEKFVIKEAPQHDMERQGHTIKKKSPGFIVYRGCSPCLTARCV